MPRLRWVMMVVGCAGCAAILGDDFDIEDSDKVVAASSTASSAASGGGTGGAGGSSVPHPCDLGAVGVCGASMKCSVVDFATGETGCIGAGTHAAWTYCVTDVDCVEGTFCDPPSQVCLPVCAVDANCVTGGYCVQAAADSTGMNPVVGLKVCTSNCDPVNGAPCDSSLGSLTCIPFTKDGTTYEQFHCWQGGFIAVGQPCTDYTQCVVGALCVDAGAGNTCYAWCDIAGAVAPCAPPPVCTPVNNGVYSHGQEYGICI